MRDLYKKILIGIALLFTQQAYAEDYRLLVIPDNIVTENVAVDSYIYNATSEFFADEIISIINSTDNISAPTVSETRSSLKNDPSKMLAAKSLTSRFKTSYNVDYVTLKRLAEKSGAKYVLLLTSTIDAENYILRRTPWDFLNIPGASVVDPAYKISTYAVLVNTENNSKIWADTYYKTISVCENRIITRGPSPQTEQLGKIKDYSRYVCPQIAQNVQKTILPPEVYENESNQIYYDMGNIDNVFTKKYRHLGKEYDKVKAQKQAEYNIFKEDTKEKYENYKKDRATKKIEKERKKTEMLNVEAKQVQENSNINDISNKIKQKTDGFKNAIFKKQSNDLDYCELIKIEIEKKKKNNLYGEFQTNQPELRSYN